VTAPAEGPVTVTLTDDERRWRTMRTWELRDELAQVTADLAAAERVVANVRAQVEAVLDATEWNGWGGRHRLEERIRRALLPAAPTGEER
jgi:hypothetical protein